MDERENKRDHARGQLQRELDDLRAANLALTQQLDEAESRLARATDASAERLFRAVFDVLPDAVVIADDDGRYLDANDAACALFGLSKGELVGRFVHEFAGPSHDVASEWTTFRRANSLTGTFPLKRADGEVRLLDYAAVANVFPRQHVSVLRDVTDRHTKAQTTQELLAWVVSSSNNAIVTKDLSGTVTSWNRAAEELFGYSAAEAVGQDIRFLIPPERQHEQDEILRRVIEGKAINRLETVRVGKGGRHIEVEVSISPITTHDGRVVGASKIALDLTPRRRSEVALRTLEEQLRQSQKMEAVGQLAGGIAHDFNNLLTVILSYTELIRTSLPSGDPMRLDLEELAKAGNRAAELTNHLLAFSRKQIMQPTTVDLSMVLRNLERMLRRVIGEDIELTLLTPATVDPVFVDDGHIGQVIMNLVVNARDAMPTGGKLLIEIDNVELDVAYASTHLGVVPGPHVVVAISDTGVGMTAETRERIFEPFFTTKAVGKGTGLGLATVFGIVKQSGGHIWVYSEPGRGSTFKVYFPRANGSAIDRPTPSPEPELRRPTETILLVEDELQVRNVMCVTLRRAGYVVLEASNGGEALLTIEKFTGRIDLVLTDVVMPHMSGRQLAERLRAVRPELRMLYVSGYTENSIVHNGILDAGIAFLQKPVTPQLLLRKVRAVIDDS